MIRNSLFIISYIMMAVSLASAQTASGPPEIYSIYNVTVDETAATSRLASRRAQNKAQRIALDMLLRKILRAEDYQTLAPLPDKAITALVSGFEVVDEKSSSVRYIADFTVHFSRDKIYAFLSRQHIPFAETLSDPVHIIAVLEQDGAALLWEKNNRWRQAWAAYDTANNLVPVRMVTPSLATRLALPLWQALAADPGTLTSFARQFNLGRLYVVKARVDYDPAQGHDRLLLTMTGRDGAEFTREITAENPVSDRLTARENLYTQAIAAATYWLDNQWKEQVMVHFGQSAHAVLLVRYDHPDDWFRMKKILESLSLIRTVTYQYFQKTEAQLDIEYSGHLDQIALTLAQQGLALSAPTGEGPWIVTMKKDGL